MPVAFLGLGSNLGNRAANLDHALLEMEAVGVRVASLSSLYNTAPVDFQAQPGFLNQVAAVRTDLPAAGLLSACLGIEAGMGRRRAIRRGPRVIDLDLLLYGELICSSNRLTLPHPRMHLRRFVLVPLAEISPETRHPLLGKTIRQLLEELESRPGAGDEACIRMGGEVRRRVDPPGSLG